MSMNKSVFYENFSHIYQKEIFLHKPIPDENIRVFSRYNNLYIVDCADIPENLHNNDFNHFAIEKTEYITECLSFAYYSTYVAVYPYLLDKSIEDMKKETIKRILNYNHFTSPLTKKVDFILKLEKKDNKYFINYYVNNNVINIKKSTRMHDLVNILNLQKRTEIYKKASEAFDLLLNNVNVNIHERNERKNEHDSVDDHVHVNVNIHERQHDNVPSTQILKTGVSLYNYQKDDIKYMKFIENNVDQNTNCITYNYIEMYKVLNGLFVNYNDTLIESDIINFKEKQKKIRYMGGNLISEVGLGKTIITLYYILQNQDQENHFLEFSENCNYFYKRGKSKGKTCDKKKQSDLYCKEHINTPFIDKRKTIYKNLNDFDTHDFISGKLFKTNATLIICPAQLCDQWIREFYTKFDTKHRVLLIATFDQYTNLTFGDLLFADIVVVSYNFLTNNKYLNIKRKNKWSDLTTEQLLNSKDFNFFDLFYWKRIVLDEAHELNNQRVLVDRLLKLKTRYRWNITGTPFAHGLEGFLSLMRFNTDIHKTTNGQQVLDVAHDISDTRSAHDDNDTDSDYEETYYNNNNNVKRLLLFGLDNDVIQKSSFLFKRNTKESIKNEYEKHIITDHTHLLEFTKQERNIYDSYIDTKNIDFLIKLCCHCELNHETKEMIQRCESLDEIQNVLLQFNQDKLNSFKTKSANLKREIESCEEQTETEEIRLKLATLRKQYTIINKKISETERTYNYLKHSLVSSEETTCPICLDEIGDLVITQCGHRFCKDCINTLCTFNTHIKCPSCKTEMTSKDLYYLDKSMRTAQTTTQDNELDDLVQSIKSTKIGNIIYFLKQLTRSNASDATSEQRSNASERRDKVIIFSQWDELLHKVGSIMSKHVNIVYCNGTVYQRRLAISKFNNDQNTNIILLSSKNAASGINLTSANKIIFLEPIYGTEDYRKDIESQAIGRADRIGQTRPIEIHRFIIKDTVEQDTLANEGTSEAKPSDANEPSEGTSEGEA